MTAEYTAAEARHDARLRDIERLCRLLWEAAADADPTIRHHPIGHHARTAAA